MLREGRATEAAPDLHALEVRRAEMLRALGAPRVPQLVQRSAPVLVSIVMPVRDPGPLLEEQLRSLAEQDYPGPWELVLSDNGSADGSVVSAAACWGEHLSGLRIVDASDRPGASRARNVGTAAARGDLVLYCDADDVADPTWMSSMVRAATGASLVAGELENDRLNPPEIRRWRGTSDGLAAPMSFLPFAPSASLGVWKDVWTDVGGWREDFTFAAGEDVDFCWRAQLQGHTLAMAPGAVMHYRHRPGLRPLARQVYRYAWTDARLYRDYRRHGAERRRVREVLGRWSYSATRLPYLLMNPTRRGLWVLVTAANAGRLVGSLRHRVLYP